jgi:uncharacterized protein
MVLEKIYKSMIVFIGSSITALGIVIFLKGNMGVDPISTFLLGVLKLFPIKFGTASQIFNIALLILLFFLDKRLLGLGSVINAFSVGFMINIFTEISFIQTLSLPLVISIILGPVILGFGLGIYLTADMGSGALEGLMIYISNKKKISIKTIRIILDACLVTIGLLLGAVVNVGTIAGVLLIGPIIELTLKTINKIKIKYM